MDGFAGANLCVAINSILVARLALSLKMDEEERSYRSGPSSFTATGTDRNPFNIKNRLAGGPISVSIMTETQVDAPSEYEKGEISKEYSDVELQSMPRIFDCRRQSR